MKYTESKERKRLGCKKINTASDKHVQKWCDEWKTAIKRVWLTCDLDPWYAEAIQFLNCFSLLVSPFCSWKHPWVNRQQNQNHDLKSESLCVHMNICTRHIHLWKCLWTGESICVSCIFHVKHCIINRGTNEQEWHSELKEDVSAK